jgi:hypothetical protein
MTRETLFLTTFEAQFAAVFGWSAAQALEGKRPFAPGDLPGFAIELGETTYTAFNVSGWPINGRQQFAIRIYWSHPQWILPRDLHSVAITSRRSKHSSPVATLHPAPIPAIRTRSIPSASNTSIPPHTTNWTLALSSLCGRFMISLSIDYAFTANSFVLRRSCRSIYITDIAT